MTPALMQYLCDPVDQSELKLVNAQTDGAGNIVSGELQSASGRSYPIIAGVPRFVDIDERVSVVSFGDEWNFFNYDEFKTNWLNHVVRNTFGTIDYFRGKVVVDAGAGSGMQSKWIREAGASHVIALELSQSVDGVIKRNLEGMEGVDIVHCSIDHPPIRKRSIRGLVICHNVIQHTPSVEKTAAALWALVGDGGEFAFNCYMKREHSRVWMVRYSYYQILRNFLSKRSFRFLLNYSRVMAVLRFVPLLGWLLEKSLTMTRGDVPEGPNWMKRAYKLGVLNTFDWYGSHSYQHHKTETELRALIAQLQPDEGKVRNLDEHFQWPQPIGCAFRLER